VEPDAERPDVTNKVAVIGAGIAGLSCARVLRRSGCYVEVFEQDRIIGGRIATTRLGLSPFDHGAQYVTGRSQSFRTYLDELVGSGYAARWAPTAADGTAASQLMPWFVGTPGMSSIVRPLAEGVRLHTERRVHTLQRASEGWYLWFEDETRAGPFSAVAIATPAPEARLLVGRLDELARPLDRVRTSPCWAVLVRLDDRVFPVQDVFSDMSEVVRWVARNNAKPGRSLRGDHIVIHASPRWTRETEDVEADVVASELWNEVCNILSLPPTRPAQISAHLWRYGLVEEALGETYLFSSVHRVGIAGDWCHGRLAEHAFDSGTGLGRAIVNALD
jgi:predicted NAD/FAD-dependent oxidoreductase